MIELEKLEQIEPLEDLELEHALWCHHLRSLNEIVVT